MHYSTDNGFIEFILFGYFTIVVFLNHLMANMCISTIIFEPKLELQSSSEYIF